MGFCQDHIAIQGATLSQEEGKRNEKNLMLKRKFRIPKGIRFNNSRLFSAPFFLLKMRENGLLFNRFAVIVSKKIDKRSVIRNKIKRLINSCTIDLNKGLKQGWDFLFIVKKAALGKSRQELYSEIKHNIERA